MELYTYLTTDVLDTVTETLSVGNLNLDVVMVAGVFGAGVITPEAEMGLCIAVFKVVSGFKPIVGLCRVFAPC